LSNRRAGVESILVESTSVRVKKGMRSRVLPEILRLDPEKDHERIIFLSCRCDFPFDTTRALELALFRTFCVPSIGALLDRTGEMGRRPQKRYDDTDLIVSEMMEHGHSSERGRRALARMNEIHGRFQISNADFLYVLSTFLFEPIRWNGRCGWRPLVDQERTAMFHFWRTVGAAMGIREIPSAYTEFEQYNLEYERTHFRNNPASSRVAEATMRMFAGWAPALLRGIVPTLMGALMDAPLRAALRLPEPAAGLPPALEGLLRARGWLAHALWPRRRPSLRTAMKHRTYPCGYTIETLGPEAGERANDK
jgi:hypothetical protein